MICRRMIEYYDAIKLICRKRPDFLAIVIVRKVTLRVLYYFKVKIDTRSFL